MIATRMLYLINPPLCNWIWIEYPLFLLRDQKKKNFFQNPCPSYKNHILCNYCFQLRLTYKVKKALQEQGHFVYHFKTSLQLSDFKVVIYQQRSDVLNSAKYSKAFLQVLNNICHSINNINSCSDIFNTLF